MSPHRFLRRLVSNRPASAERRGQSKDDREGYQVKSFEQPDEVAGPAGAAAYLDFGRPFTISDSARTARGRTSEEHWAMEVHENH
jgi:hypothetical protein